jgi:hypothetical protein
MTRFTRLWKSYEAWETAMWASLSMVLVVVNSLKLKSVPAVLLMLRYSKRISESFHVTEQRVGGMVLQAGVVPPRRPVVH